MSAITSSEARASSSAATIGLLTLYGRLPTTRTRPAGGRGRPPGPPPPPPPPPAPPARRRAPPRPPAARAAPPARTPPPPPPPAPVAPRPAATPALDLVFSRVDAFTSTGVVFLAPDVNAGLLDAHAGCHQRLGAFGREAWPHYAPGVWVPHCTLAMDMADGLDRALGVARKG